MRQYTHAGHVFEVSDAGPREGEAVLLLHGFPEDAKAWDGVAPLLHRGGLRTLAPDQRGYSPGARPKSRAAYGLDHLVADAVALLDATGVRRAHVVGHDWGAGVAWALAARHPERVATLVALATPHPAALRRVLWTSRQWLLSYYMVLFQVPWLPEQISSRILRSALLATGLNPAAADRYARAFAAPSSLTGPMNWYRAMRPDDSRLPAVAVPTTYVWGRRDAYLGRAAAQATRDFVDADYLFAEVDSTHWLPENNPELVARYVLERVRKSRPDLGI